MTLPKQIFPSEFEDAVAEGYVIAGSAPKVLERLRADIAATGINYALCRFAYGDLSFEESARSVRLFSREVMPELSPGQGNVGNTRMPATVVDRIGHYGTGKLSIDMLLLPVPLKTSSLGAPPLRVALSSTSFGPRASGSPHERAGGSRSGRP